MNKKLEALEASRRIRKLLEDKYGLLIYVDDLDLIEKALKRLGLYESNQIFIKRAKKLKALEIIKDKRVDVRFLQECENLEQYNQSISMNWNDEKEAEYHNELLNQEEYNLLKEELL